MKNLLDKIIDENKDFLQLRGKDFFISHAQGQSPQITLVTCSDSRVQATVFQKEAINKVFTIENIGNQIITSEGSVDYGIYHLKTPILLILGHSDCGAIKALLKGCSEERETIKEEVEQMNHILANLDNGGNIKNPSPVIQSNVHSQVEIALKKYKNLIEKNELMVVGAYYDFANDLGKGYGKILILNINGILKTN